MGLSAGTRLGPYEILAPLGAGGMGEVYRARDTRLERTVAIKVLPAHLSSNPDLKQRFEREARTISSLNHPHICTLYDVGSQDGVDFLVMEYLQGESLADRLQKGALPLDQVLKIGIEIADALDKAHRAAIVHRDLKPGNVMLTKSGAKLMDFGLAKPAEMAAGAASDSVARTIAQPLTTEGTFVGTLQYMSPEQIEGREADARSDVFALGATLYEMITGQRAFEGKTPASTAAAILATEPKPISMVQPLSPPALEHIVKTCLAKDGDERCQTAHDLKLQLKWIAETGLQGASGPTMGLRRSRERLAWMVALAALVAALTGLSPWALLHREPQRLLITTLQLPPKSRLVVNGRNGPPAISPDGTRVAFLVDVEGTQSIWIRSLDTSEAIRLPGTEGAFVPFWSPDSRWIAFFADGKLRKVPVSGGPPQDICAVNDSRGGSWGKNGIILLTTKGRSSEIYRVADTGGEPVQVTKFQENIGSHRWPHFLPDGKHFLYLASPVGSIHSGNQIRMASVDGKEDKLILFASSNPEFFEGQLVFVRDGTLMTAPLDGDSGKITGDARALPISVSYDSLFTSGAFSVSNTGMLLYQKGGGGTELQWLNAAGKPIGTLGVPAVYGSLRIAPDDKHVAVTLAHGTGLDVWLLDTVRNASSRVTFSGVIPSTSPGWSPDGHSIAYSENVGKGKLQLFHRATDGTGEEQEVSAFSDLDEWLTDWSPDGKYLLFFTLAPKTRLDVWAVPADGGGKPIPIARGPHNELNARFSPDGRWVAYVSDENGGNEVYLVPFQHGQGKWQVSTQGGNDVVWGRDGKTLYYTSGRDDMWSVRVNARSDAVELGTPQRIFNSPIKVNQNGSFDVTRDGRFLINSPGIAGDQPMTLIQNWKALLNR